jgi:hypothetical protein
VWSKIFPVNRRILLSDIKQPYNMYRRFILFTAISSLLLCGCDYARMSDQESLRPYEIAFPEMPAGSIPVNGGINILRETKPEDLHNPVPRTEASVNEGEIRYGYYCIMCHGAKADGNGTVGQSFSPLPANLAGSYVQQQKDGELFYKISLGYRRHPPLYYTVAETDRWLIINYIRSLGNK